MGNVNKRLKIVVVGLHFGRTIIEENLLQGSGSAYFELVGVSSLVKEEVDCFSMKYGVRGYYSLESVLADPEVDAVGLFVGPFERAKLISLIIEAGKHVMTTKPFETDPDAALAVLKRAQELKKVVHLNSPSPLPSPDMVQIKEWQEEFKLGRPLAARADIWANYRELADGTWYDDPVKCPVAPIFRLGIYLINDLIRIFGKPEAVFVMTSRFFTERPTPDHAQLSIRFQSGALATVFSSFCVNDAQWWLSSLTLNHENGTVYRNVGPVKSKNPQFQPELAVVVNREGKPFSQTCIASGSGEDYSWKSFYQKILGEILENEISPEDIVDGLRVIRAMTISQQTGKYVTL